MQEINWNNFAAKFNEKEQSSFEWFSYLLFCDEFGKSVGIFRYRNQAGIETEPIEYEGKLIGFQAKYFETGIGSNKNKLIDSIKKAKNRNPLLCEIVFYINKEFSESSIKGQKEPRYKIDIENYASSVGIEIEWRSKSFFESPFVCDKNATIAEHFFSLENTMIDFVGELIEHTESILSRIHSNMQFKGAEIKIDRRQTVKDLKAHFDGCSLVVLSGEAGVGKTAIVKDYYDLVKGTTPFFVFKAIEFNVPNINELFSGYGRFTFRDFIEEHQALSEKIIVIDSAEKLFDIEYSEVFQEFLSVLIAANWSILFTTRYDYIDTLEFQLTDIHRTTFRSHNIKRLTPEELSNLSETYDFNLPQSEKMLELLMTPFYLNEYLRASNNVNESVSYRDFKDALWKKQIVKVEYRKNNAHIRREKCFLKIAHYRANKGNLVIPADECDEETLRYLEIDEVIKHDPVLGGYFITHDIYEEWALERIIEREFHNTANHQEFFQSIGTSLPIRRALRNWLSEKLAENADKVKDLIEGIITDGGVASYWKDEICISVLLSDYAETFLQLLKRKLLEDNANMLMRLVFLLRIACKDIDEDFFAMLGITKREQDISTIFVYKPKGNGWDSVIEFIFKHKEEMEFQNANIVIPLLDDWNSKNKNGETTKSASQIALYYYAHYNEIIKTGTGRYSSRDEKKEQLIRVILNGASEISVELKTIFDEVLAKKSTDYRPKYYDIIAMILGSIADGSEVVRVLPTYVIDLANLFWFQPPNEERVYNYHLLGVESHFGLSHNHDFNYFPSSALQTPIFQLLRIAPAETMEFILSFTNRAVEYYRKSEFGDEVSEVEVVFNETESSKQYISNRLWNMYRGTHVSTHLLESMHMALERWLLFSAKSTSREDLESWCLYLLKKTKSASITAVVTSICLAHPSKLFHIASILFKTKEFILYDTGRLLQDQHVKGTYSIGYGWNNNTKLYQDERIKTCDDPHRKLSLEHLAFKYQLEKSEDESEDGFKQRQEGIWNILDAHYAQLPEQSVETDSDKTWRLFLARMDRRKMKTEVEENDGNVIVKFHPEIDPDLMKFSEDSTSAATDAIKHTSLKLWASYRFNGNPDYQQYEAYEGNPDSVIAETREIVEDLKTGKDPFPLFNHSIPSYTCYVLIRDFEDELSPEDKAFCRDIIIQYAEIPLTTPDYQYQIDDGTEPSITVLPLIMRHFPEKSKEIKSLLVLLLLNPWREIVTFTTRGIISWMWETNFDDAQAVFLGYLLLNPKYIDLRTEVMRDNRKDDIYGIQETKVVELFTKKCEAEFDKITTNNISFTDLEDLDNLDFTAHEVAFMLIPPNTKNIDHASFLNITLPLWAKEFNNNDSEVDYHTKIGFMNKFAYFILCSSKDEIQAYLQPFIDNFSNSSDMAQLFQEFISVENIINHYDEFWIVWNAFYDCVVETYKKQPSSHFSNELVHNYLLAGPYWEKDIKEWHTLKERNKRFYKRVSEDIGHHPSVLYSISKILNGVGSNFIDDGVIWISSILQKNPEYTSAELETNTVYYLENIMKRYILLNRQKIKGSLSIRNRVIIVLTFLLEKGSTTGFLLREGIL